MPVVINKNEIIYGGNAHHITTCDVNADMNYKFTVKYLDRSCYVYNPLPTTVQILLFHGTTPQDGLHKVTIPPGFRTIKVCNLQGSKIYHYHLSIAGISADHQFIRLENTHKSKQIYIVSTNTPPTLKALGTVAVLGLTDKVPRPDTLGRALSQIPFPRTLINELCRSHYTLLNTQLGR